MFNGAREFVAEGYRFTAHIGAFEKKLLKSVHLKLNILKKFPDGRDSSGIAVKVDLMEQYSLAFFCERIQKQCQ